MTRMQQCNRRRAFMASLDELPYLDAQTIRAMIDAYTEFFQSIRDARYNYMKPSTARVFATELVIELTRRPELDPLVLNVIQAQPCTP
jgi:hypothetical protein